MSEFKPCPFCGSGVLYETRRSGYLDETPTMFCNSCKAVVTWEQVEEEGVNDKTRTFVREHWNTRYERMCHPVIAITDDGGYEYALCSECDCLIELEDNYCPNCGAKVVEE